MTAHRIRLVAGEEPGTGVVEIDGIDIAPAVKGATLRMVTGHLPVLAVELNPVAAETELYAYVISALTEQRTDLNALTEQLRGDLVDELRQIDPEELEAGALQRVGLAGSVSTMGAAFLEEIVERLR